MTTVLQ